jgi:antitoxin VapB
VSESNKPKVNRLLKNVERPESPNCEDVIGMCQASLIVPDGEGRWDSWFESEGVTEDFMVERAQQEPQERESF